MFSRVGTRGCRTTINPATMPKATCDATNQSQSMRLSRRGFNSAIGDAFTLIAWTVVGYLLLMLFLKPNKVSFKLLRSMQ